MLFHEIQKSRKSGEQSRGGGIATPDYPPVHAVLLPEYICVDDEDGEGGVDGLDNVCVYFLKKHRCWDPLVRTVRLSVHFLLVMGLLFGGAVFLAEFEDPVDSLVLPSTNRSQREVKKGVGHFFV